VFNILFGDQGQVGDLISVVGHKILQRAFVVFSNLVRGQAGHDDGVKEMRPQTEIEKKWELIRTRPRLRSVKRAGSMQTN
jgi:hypothetical protein